ncbi:MAG TPA: ABC-type transport auxiliary lipoprotein family protein, partial [Thermoanaerobaculia bacterium]|nr:ABC-type transport auxiliary lipoprotein family protein [Thermoanaerobaculia bacterium]
MMIRLRGCTIALTLLLAGCGFFSRSKSQYYSLEPMGPEAAPSAATMSGVPIGIDGVELPPGIDRKEIVVRGTDNRLEVRSAQQWASSLEQMVIHTLAFDLAKRLPVGMVVLPGQAKPA